MVTLLLHRIDGEAEKNVALIVALLVLIRITKANDGQDAFFFPLSNNVICCLPLAIEGGKC